MGGRLLSPIYRIFRHAHKGKNGAKKVDERRSKVKEKKSSNTSKDEKDLSDIPYGFIVEVLVPLAIKRCVKQAIKRREIPQALESVEVPEFQFYDTEEKIFLILTIRCFNKVEESTMTIYKPNGENLCSSKPVVFFDIERKTSFLKRSIQKKIQEWEEKKKEATQGWQQETEVVFFEV